MRTLSDVLRTARTRAKLTQRALAGRIGCSSVFLSQVENGHRELSGPMITRILEACNCHLKVEKTRGKAKTQPTKAAAGAGPQAS